ncbi:MULTISPECIES: hypothetical protein [Rhizobium]|uniref:Uncharacterized protein n=1 Tax=Rhizobium tropici TaxID=398 RepID=A0A329YEH2_RHITR|nr:MULTISPECIES: hypothetical protein [Rhizobium]MBB3290101.1 hypothetical protein [Rhizobium sp. BK252]MBB3405011.1 hypothetical protein [Rhizobium sp. BK289]MBB3417557.1 hypothetical protein [Rhizobium sp. BK284]MBB3485267.1 hypothetical protein [Rhizobium sp. BK347]MDK4720898.1 hypothetical protein [Rhizobium sp. CNPSo 3968]
MRKTISLTWQWSVRILCAVALLFVGFAHQPVVATADEISPLEIAQYRLPDGSLPILCITYKDADGKVHGKAYAPGCEACRIASAAVLPTPPTDVYERLVSQRGEIVVVKSEAFYRQLYPPNTGPRAPPILETVG